ncbi:MAG: hypothetical protein OXF26_01610 [Alphaproteobacteria bacterium]|nr:hypothetical protein [Alphaproteobacteria bacterium]MCY4229584.1 hypothetical protein [Alphaproteobacteria bacterium]MCY4318554.1 hypothetical protein [Alphaproteobacteria bacterium]
MLLSDFTLVEIEKPGGNDARSHGKESERVPSHNLTPSADRQDAFGG